MLSDPFPCATCGDDARRCSCARSIVVIDNGERDTLGRLLAQRGPLDAMREIADLVPDPVIEERPPNRRQRRRMARGNR